MNEEHTLEKLRNEEHTLEKLRIVEGLSAVKEEVKGLGNKIESLDKSLHGNGREGLIVRVSNLEMTDKQRNYLHKILWVGVILFLGKAGIDIGDLVLGLLK